MLFIMFVFLLEILTIAEWWSNSTCNLYGDEEALRLFGREHCMVIMNHKYDVDWLWSWFICEKLGMLGVSIIEFYCEHI